MKFNPYLEIILAAIIFGSTGVFVKILALPPTTIALFRLGSPAIILSIYFLFQRKKGLFKKINKQIIIGSSLFSIRMYFYFLGFTLTSISNAVIILYTWPIFGVLFSSFYLKEKISIRTSLLFSLSFVGILLVFIGKEFSLSNSDFLGMMCVLISSILAAISLVIFKKELNNYSNSEMLFYNNFIGVLWFLPFLFVIPPINMITLSIGFFYGSLIGILAFGIYYLGLKQISASKAFLLTYFEVLSGVLFGVLLFNEILTWNMMVGGFLIITSAILLKK